MLNVEPKQLVFRDVRLNQPYTTTICIENPLSAAVEFSLKATAPARYDIKPNQITLAPRQAISVTVRLLMRTFQDTSRGANEFNDKIHIRSPYFDQMVQVHVYMHHQTVKSRSPSPSERASSRLKAGGDIPPVSRSSDLINELNAQIKVKDHRIAELEAMVGNLKSKHPDLERIIAARVEQERGVFEDNSKQILDILRRKDGEITQLQKQVTDLTDALETQLESSRIDAEQSAQSEGRSRDFWTGRAAATVGPTHRELNDLLEQTRKALEAEKKAHLHTRDELNHAYSALEEQRLQAAQGGGAARLEPQSWRELRALREQTLDQAEQLKALSDENNRLRREAQEQRALGEQLSQALQEVSRLRGDVVHYQKKYTALEAEHSSLTETLTRTEQALSEQRAHCQQLRDDLEHAQRQRARPASAAADVSRGGNTSRVSWQPAAEEAPRRHQHDTGRDDHNTSHVVDGSRFEESVGGGVATSTPAFYGLHPPETAQQALEQKNTLIGLYKDRLERYEEEIEELKGRVVEGQTMERDLRERLAEVEKQLQGRDQEGRLLSERVERLKSEREASAHEVQDKDVQLRSALERANAQSQSAAVNDAHLWWAYIWHTLKQQQENAVSAGMSGDATISASTDHPFITNVGAGSSAFGVAQPGNVDFVPPHDTAAAVHLVRLKDNLRAQAIEIAQLRQERIGRKLTCKKELDAVKEQNENLQREIVRLQAQSRIHRADKDLKIAELAKTIQTLSVRGDMHAQAAAARQEVEAEKLTNHHLRADLDSYRSMLEEEQRKLLQTRKEVADLQAQIDSSLVVQSVVNVPGVSPATLIELMAGQITQLESEVAKSRASYDEAAQQLRTLQRAIQTAQQRRQSLAAEGGQITPPNERGRAQAVGSATGQRSRSLSPAVGRRPSSVRNSDPLRRSTSSLRPFEQPDGPVDMNLSFGDEDGVEGTPNSRTTWFTGAPQSITIDGEATPKMVVDSLDRAVLAQRVASQEATIAELTQLVEELKSANIKADRERLVAADAADESDWVEWERSLRKADLLQTLLDEARAEVKALHARNVELEKSLSDVHSSRLAEGWNARNAAPVTVGGATEGSVFYEDAPLMGNHTSDMGSYAGPEVNFEENQKELESTKILLRERTTQLKIIMETLDALQVAGVKNSSKFHSEDEYLFSRRPGDRHAPSANTSAEGDVDFAGMLGGAGGSRSGPAGLAAVESGWGMQALIKRVVELTTELTSQCAIASLEARKAEDLELANRRQAKEINKLKLNLRNCEESASRATLQLNSVCTQLQEGDRNHIEAMAALRSENDALTTALRESEASLEAAEIKITALKQQAEIADNIDFMGWLEMVTLDNQKIITDSASARSPSADSMAQPAQGHAASGAESAVFNDKKIGDSTVRELVVGLVMQWKEYVSTVPQMKPLTTPAGSVSKLSKPEQRFLQRVTDLVLNANERAIKAQVEAQSASARIRQVEHANEIAVERLRICATHLNRYRKRCHAFEKVLSSDRKHQGIKQGKLESMLKVALADLRAKHTKAVEALRAEKRDRMINDVKRAMDSQQLRKLQAQVAELEARGTATLRARDEAVASLEGKLKNAEEGMYKWFKVELPRLVSGLPATEDTLSSYYKENLDPNFGLEPSPYAMPSSATDTAQPISTHLMSALGMDRTYALSQALCSSRAAMTVQEMRISGLTEKLSILKERNLALEGVLVRWKDEIQRSIASNTVPAVEQRAGSILQAASATQEPDDGLDQYLAHVPGAASGVAQGHVSAIANANRVDAAIRQVYSYAESEAQLNAKVQELSTRMIELEEENIELQGKLEQASARAGEMKALVDVVMGDEQQLKTKATQQLTKIRLSAAQAHAEEMRSMRQSYEGEINRLRAELESVAVAVEEAKLTTVDTTAWQRMVAGEDGAQGAYATGPRPTPVKHYVPTPPASEERPAIAEREKEWKKKGSKAKKHRKHKRSQERSTSTSSSSSSTSTSSSDASSSSESGDSSGGEGGAPQRRAHRSTHGRGKSTKRNRDSVPAANEEGRAPGGDGQAASAGLQFQAAEQATAAQAYAQTLRGAEQPRQTPRATTRRRKDPMDVRVTPSTNADSSASVSLSYLNQQQDLAEVQVENLERLLELERRKHEETKFEMAELQQMLQIQQNAFREHLNRTEHGAAAAAGPPGPGPVAMSLGAATTSAPQGLTAQRAGPATRPQQQAARPDQDISLSTFDESFSTPSLSPPAPTHAPPAQGAQQSRPAAPQSMHQAQQMEAATAPVETERSVRDQRSQTMPSYRADPIGAILSEIQREDPGLWPSLSTLLDELMAVLHGLSERTQMLDTRIEVRTALAMAARVKIVCTSSAAGRSLASAVADAGATQLPPTAASRPTAPARTDRADDGSAASSSSRGHGLADLASETADPKDFVGRLQALAGRVKLIEADLKDDNTPERHLYLMRDLRMRVLEVEKTLSAELAMRETQWNAERAALKRKADENAELAEQARRGQSESMSAMRQRYEESLRNAEEALENSTRAAAQELERLQTVIAQQQQLLQLHEQRAAAQAYPPPAPIVAGSSATSISSHHSMAGSRTTPPPPPSVISAPPTVPSAPAASVLPTGGAQPPTPGTSAKDLSEFLRMQRLVNETGDHLEYTRQQRQQIEALHAREINELKSHFARYRRAQAEVVRSLEEQLQELHDQQAAAESNAASTKVGAEPVASAGAKGAVKMSVNDSLTGGVSLAANLTTLPEAEDVIRKLEFRYRLKAAELEAVLGTLGRLAAGEGDASLARDLDQSYADLSYSFEGAVGVAIRPPRGPGTAAQADSGEHFASAAREMQIELYEARIMTADKEIEALHRNLQKERATVVALRAQLQAYGDSGEVRNTKASNRAASVGRGQVGSSPVPAARPGRAQDEPVLPSQAAGTAGAGGQPVARVLTRRGSTGMMVGSAAAALFPAAARASGAATAASQPVAGGRAPSAGASIASTVITAPSAAALTAAAQTGAPTAAVDPLLDFTRDYNIPEVKADSEKMRLLVRRVNEMRRSARTEIHQLREQIALSTSGDYAQASETIIQLRQKITDLQERLKAKEETAKVYRAAATTGRTTVAQWQEDHKGLAQQVHTLTLAIEAKDMLVKDLRSKLEACQNALSAAHREGEAPSATVLKMLGVPIIGAPAVGAVVAPPPADVDKLTATELRTRLREAELVRKRSQRRLEELKEETKRLEGEIARLKKDNDDLTAAAEQLRADKRTLQSQLKSYKGVQEKYLQLQDQLQAARTDEKVVAEEKKKIEVALRRELDLERQNRRDLEVENQRMRQRLGEAPRDVDAAATGAVGEGTVRSAADFMASTVGRSTAAAGYEENLFGSSTGRAGAAATTAGRAETRKPSIPTQRRASAGSGAAVETPEPLGARRGGGATTVTGLPSVLEDSAGDISDVLAAIGASPLHIGLGLNPRNSSMSSAYTRNATGRGSTLDRRNLASPAEPSPPGTVSSTERRFQDLMRDQRGSPVRYGGRR